METCCMKTSRNAWQSITKNLHNIRFGLEITRTCPKCESVVVLKLNIITVG